MDDRTIMVNHNTKGEHEKKVIICCQKGYFYQTEGKLEQALEEYSKAIELDLKCIIAYNNRGNVYQSMQEFDKAITDFTQIISMNNEYEGIYYTYINRGNAYSNKKWYKEALQDYNSAISLNDKCIEGYLYRADIYIKLNQLNDTVIDCNKALEINPTSDEVHYRVGNIYTKAKMYNEAMQHFTQAIKINPFNKEAYNNKGVLFIYQGEYENALKEFECALEIDPNHISSADNKKVTLEVIGKKFADYINKYSMPDDIKYNLIDLYTSILEMRRKMMYTQAEAVGHYTKVQNLKYLFKPKIASEDNEKSPNLRINNAAYMNDPTEGEVFIELLKQYGVDSDVLTNLYGRKSRSGREVFNNRNYVFLTSFSRAIDTSLPMWVQYGDDGEGCCLVFESSFFNSIEEGLSENLLEYNFDASTENSISNIQFKCSASITVPEQVADNCYCLYEVMYIPIINNTYMLDKEEYIRLIKNISIKLNKLHEQIKDTKENKVIKEIIHNMLDQVRFLFKDKNYEHEKELRVVKFATNGQIEWTSNAEGHRVPHAYINLERKINCKEVILGPKVHNGVEIANFLYYTNQVDEVTKSQIKYQ